MSQTPRYSAGPGPVAGAYLLRDAQTGAEVHVAPGAGNNAFEMTVRGKRVLFSPYAVPQEWIAKPAMSGNPLLWPWANRIDGDTYYVNGRPYRLNPGLQNFRADGNRKPIHGMLLYAKEWTVTRAEATQQGAELTSRFAFYRYPQLMAQFPFAHELEMTYRLRDGALEVITVIESRAAEPMPVSLGFHPYFQVNDAPRDEWTVRIPARERLTLSKELIPTGERTEIPVPVPLKLAGIGLDDVFTALEPNAVFSVEGKREKVSVEFGPKFTVGVVYAPQGRAFICFEPMTAPTNAFNAAHQGWYQGLQFVVPGGVWRESFTIRPTGF